MSKSSSPLPCLRRLVVTAMFGAAALVTSRAATLSFDATLHMQPTANSPVIGTVPAGTSITPLLREELAAVGLDLPPAGWIAVRSAGPFEGFVRNRHVQQDGTIEPGAEIRLQPLSNAPLLLKVEEGDDATAREPVGDWSRATIRTDLFVYVNALPPESRSSETSMPAAEPAPIDAAPMTDTAEVAMDQPEARPRTEKPRKPKTARKEKAEPVPVETEGAPRTFTGYLMRTRRFLGRGPKYDYQLVDEEGRRIVLLDVSSLLATSPVERFENRRVTIYGPGLARPDVKDVIIRVQTMRLNE